MASPALPPLSLDIEIICAKPLVTGTRRSRAEPAAATSSERHLLCSSFSSSSSGDAPVLGCLPPPPSDYVRVERFFIFVLIWHLGGLCSASLS